MAKAVAKSSKKPTAKKPAANASPTGRQIYKVALASIIGSVIEQYDFLVTGVIAATVWGGVFFKLPAVAAVSAAIGVYGLGVIIRPVGAYIFGNIADRVGRKDALVYALVLMGVSTLAIGLTPTYDSIGIAAHDECRAEGRMSGERQFMGLGEDACAVVGLRAGGGKQECGLGEIGPLGEILHRRRGQPFAIQHHRQRIAPIGCRTEHVDFDKTAPHRTCFP